jgi:phage terminase small subunit
MDEVKELSEKEELFCLYYTGESKFNATDAARRAGYENGSNIRNIAHELLTKLHIKERCSKLTEQRFKDAGYSVDRTIKEIMDIAFYDATDMFIIDEDGYLKFKGTFDEIKESFPTNVISKIKTSTIQKKIERHGETSTTTETWFTEVQFHDKKWALEMLSKLLEMKSGEERIAVVFHDFMKQHIKENA